MVDFLISIFVAKILKILQELKKMNGLLNMYFFFTRSMNFRFLLTLSFFTF